MIGFGQRVCTPLRPRCEACPVAHLCPSAAPGSDGLAGPAGPAAKEAPSASSGALAAVGNDDDVVFEGPAEAVALCLVDSERRAHAAAASCEAGLGAGAKAHGGIAGDELVDLTGDAVPEVGPDSATPSETPRRPKGSQPLGAADCEGVGGACSGDHRCSDAFVHDGGAGSGGEPEPDTGRGAKRTRMGQRLSYHVPATAEPSQLEISLEPAEEATPAPAAETESLSAGVAVWTGGTERDFDAHPGSKRPCCSGKKGAVIDEGSCEGLRGGEPAALVASVVGRKGRLKLQKRCEGDGAWASQ